VNKPLTIALFIALTTSATAGDFNLTNRSEAFAYGFLSQFKYSCSNVIISALPYKNYTGGETYSVKQFREYFAGKQLFTTYKNNVHHGRSTAYEAWLLATKSDAEYHYISCKDTLEGHPNLGRWFRMKPNL
jgi:hypothetical protein